VVGLEPRGSTGVDLSIVICTYRRPELLAACLRSCLLQQPCEDAKYEIVVVDNDVERSAQPVVEPIRQSSTISCRYVQEPVANIATARNRGVREAAGTYIAFIDDDFVVPPEWLTSVLRTFARTGADVVLGDVRPRFEDGGTPSEGVAAAYTRHAPERGGRVTVQANGYAPGARTGNAILRRSFCFVGSDGWFDPAFGRSGGEDAEFFLRLGRRQPHIVASSDAFVFEFIPLSRQTETYLVGRAEREGRNYARLVCKNAARPAWQAADLFLRGVVQITLHSLQLALRPHLAPARRLDLRIRRGLAWGKAMIAGRARDEPYR
jgi:Glycosyltransferases involved in cell wall biogenesis